MLPKIEINKTAKKRNSNVELLRFFFMFCIVFDHVYGHGSGLNYEWLYSLGTEPSTAAHLGMFNIGKIGVTGFMFISGYYGIKMSSKKILNLILITTTYAIALDLIFKNFNLYALLSDIHAFDQWWFVRDYLFLCILAPFMEIGIKNISKSTFQKIVIGILLITYVAHLISFDNSHDLTMLLSIYLLARYLRLFTPPYYHTNIRIGLPSLVC